MTEQSWGTTTVRRALWSTGLLILLAGLFGMHGLGSHAGGMGPELHPMSSAAVASAAVAPTPGAQDVVGAGARDVADSTLAVSAALVQVPLVGDMASTAMCMAVLAVGLTLLLRSLGDVPALRRYRWATTLARVLMSPGRDPDPPSLIVLSIQRC